MRTAQLLGLLLFLLFLPSVYAVCNFSSSVSIDEESGVYFFNSWFFGENIGSVENIAVTLYNQKANVLIFSDQSMTEVFRGNFVYSAELFLENGVYSYTLTNFGRSCSRTFFFEVTNGPKIVDYGVIV